METPLQDAARPQTANPALSSAADPTSRTLREARREHLAHLSAYELDSISNTVRRVLRDPSIADDAFAHGMLSAWKNYDGSIPLMNYVLHCARNYAIDHWRRAAQRDVSLSDLETEDGEVRHPAVASAAELDRVNDQFDLVTYERLCLILMGEESLGTTESTRAGRARRLLQRFMQSARADEGLGVDEYDQSDAMWANKRTHLERNVAVWLEEQEGRTVGTKTVQATMTTLRQATRTHVTTHRARQWAEEAYE